MKKRIAEMFEWNRTGPCDVRKSTEKTSDVNPDDWKGMLAELRTGRTVVKNAMWRGTLPNKSERTAKPRDDWSANQSWKTVAVKSVWTYPEGNQSMSVAWTIAGRSAAASELRQGVRTTAVWSLSRVICQGVRTNENQSELFVV